MAISSIGNHTFAFAAARVWNCLSINVVAARSFRRCIRIVSVFPWYSAVAATPAQCYAVFMESMLDRSLHNQLWTRALCLFPGKFNKSLIFLQIVSLAINFAYRLGIRLASQKIPRTRKSAVETLGTRRSWELSLILAKCRMPNFWLSSGKVMIQRRACARAMILVRSIALEYITMIRNRSHWLTSQRHCTRRGLPKMVTARSQQRFCRPPNFTTLMTIINSTFTKTQAVIAALEELELPAREVLV